MKYVDKEANGSSRRTQEVEHAREVPEECRTDDEFYASSTIENRVSAIDLQKKQRGVLTLASSSRMMLSRGALRRVFELIRSVAPHSTVVFAWKPSMILKSGHQGKNTFEKIRVARITNVAICPDEQHSM